jgi:prolyl oligopeptidase
LDEQRTPPRVVLERVPDQIRAQLVSDPEQSPLFDPYERIPDSLPTGTRDQLRAEGRAAVRDVVVPAYRRLLRFFEDRYLPGSRTSIAASDLPDGRDYYAFEVRGYTTTSLTPDAIHELGRGEVARIRDDIDRVIKQLGFEGSYAEFAEFLRTDDRFYYDKADDLLAGYRSIVKRLEAQLDKLFGRLPTIPLEVQPVPAAAAAAATTAYYVQGAPDGSRPGTVYVNLDQIHSRPKYEMEALMAHEGVPGHHLQASLARQQEDLPKFRRHTNYTAYVEGWALYSESLGADLGLYRDPYSRFGQLTYEMWRAVRLVVDTGLHARGWNRQQAIDYVAANAARSLHDITNEVDRYIARPGQALAYKVGQLRISELRRRAEERLGNRFDIEAFHDLVLGSGALPLDVLEAKVDDWLA